jgi:uncharacterized membrane protein YhaH (DUF805 family)
MSITGRTNGWNFFVWSLPANVLGAILKSNIFHSPWDSAVALLFLVSFILAIPAAVRRSHDIGQSGWFALICLIPFAAWYLILKKGDPVINQYGAPISKLRVSA